MATANPASGSARRWRRLSSPIEALKPHYDVVVVGSGYGGAVTAARLAEHGLSVCLLERGRELRPGDYPDTLVKASREFHIDTPSRSLFSPTALYDLRLNPDLSVFVGCGLGGTSLINANVALSPDADVFTGPGSAWPKQIQKEADTGWLWHWFRKARRELDPTEYPYPEKPRKFNALQDALRALDPGAELKVAPVTVAFKPAKVAPAFGVGSHPCTGCGDCVSGCNYGAKKTLLTNYLPVARDNGAAIFTQTRVRSVEKRDVAKGDPRRWVVRFQHVGAGRERFTETPLVITARRVILAAGALGTPEILWRSRHEHRLAVSTRLGEKFSGNGDVLAFAYNNVERVNGIGFGTRSPSGHEAPGACITGYFRGHTRSTRYVVEEGVIPGALSPLLSLGFALAGCRADDATQPTSGRTRSLWRVLTEPLRRRVDSTLTLLAMVEDREYGRLAWEDDRVRVVWPGAGQSPSYEEIKGVLRRIATELGGSYIPSPFGGVTVHPLGGCAMADEACEGVVNHAGEVFDPDHGAVHDGLYVSDASIIPRTLLANPLLTITALAERTASWIQRQPP